MLTRGPENDGDLDGLGNLARVKVPGDDENKRTLLYAAGSSEAKRVLGELATEMGIELHFVEFDSQGDPISGDGSSDDLSRVELFWAHGRFTGGWVSTVVSKLTNLKWVHSDFVGIDAMDKEDFLRRGILLSNGGDNFARPMAEWVMMGMLVSAKRFIHYQALSEGGLWDPSVDLEELSKKKVFLLGFGSVNRLVAEMCGPFNMEVHAWTRTEHKGISPHLQSYHFGDEIPSEIYDCDFLVVGVPLTPSTRHLLGEAELSRLKDGVVIINPARGAIFDEAALTNAAKESRFGYLLLDAFEKEPLASDSALWGRKDVTVYPHHSWSSPMVTANAINRMKHQLDLWMRGHEPEGTVDFRAGY